MRCSQLGVSAKKGLFAPDFIKSCAKVPLHYFFRFYRPDGKGWFVLNTGTTLNHGIPILKGGHTTKIMQALYADCAAQPDGFSHAELRGTIFHTEKDRPSGGRSLTLIFRCNWHCLTNYTPNVFFVGNPTDERQYKVLW